ncbi:MAG: hypothetical protein R3F62_01030 [Planctomycetota bacterium]
MRYSPLIVAVAAFSACTGSHGTGSHRGKIANWEEPQAGMAKASAEGLPMMMFFTADW